MEQYTSAEVTSW